MLAVSTGLAAVSAVENHNEIALIICDINLPDINGYEVYEALKRNYASSRVPFIFLSAYADEKDVAHGLSLGVAAYVTKPFESRQLIKLVDSILAKI